MCPAQNAYTAILFSHSHCVLHCITCSYYNYPSINTNAAKQFTVFFWHIRYRCNFGPEDKSAIVPHDMQALLRSTHKKRKNKAEQNKRKCKKVILDYDAFPTNKCVRPKVARIGKTQVGNSVKRGCQHSFVAKWPYLDHSLCLLIYENTEHLNAKWEHCHGSMVSGFRYAIGSGLSEKLKLKIAQLHAFGLSPSQIMQQHTAEVRELAMSNAVVTQDMFLLPNDVRNICRKIFGRNIHPIP